MVSKNARSASRARAARLRLFAVLIALFGVTGVVAAVHVVFALNSYGGAQREYETLRRYAPAAAAAVKPPFQLEQAESHSREAEKRDDVTGLSAINPDYAGWIRIDGTEIDYPVVHGADNEKYLNTTFSGEKNPSGAIFMDYRCEGGLGGALAVLYGHQMRNGSMFASLGNYLNGDYFAAHPVITIVTPNGETLSYGVFAARRTDITDRAFTLFGGDSWEAETYFIEQGAPENAKRFLVLSTCAAAGGSDARMLVLAAAE